MTNLFLTELAEDALTEGKAFDGVAFGTFRDMLGREITLDVDDADDFVANTQAAIDATKTESGELVGLPIDSKGHDKGDAAGWIVGIKRVGDLIQVIPKWTEVGRELISKGIRRYFSATINTGVKAVLGGTLTNWPAIRNEKGHLMLRPIELSSKLFYFEESKERELDKVREAFDKMFGYRDEIAQRGWVTETHDDYVIAEVGDKYFKIPFSEDGDETIFSSREAWKEVKKEWVEAIADKRLFYELKKKGEKSISEKTQRSNANLSNTQEHKEQSMSKENEVQDVVITEEIVPALIVETPAPATEEFPADYAELLNKFREVSQKSPQEVVKLLTEMSEQRAQERVTKLLEENQRDWDIVQLSAKLTTAGKRGLPVNPDVLSEFLMGLEADSFDQAVSIFQNITNSGLVEFTEIGHSRRRKKKVLPEVYNESLKSTLAAGNSIKDYFDMMSELGHPSDYDLAQFEEAK